MIGRRALLLDGTVALAGGTLAGCTLGGGVDWLPWTPPSPLPLQPAPALPAQLATASALATRLLDHRADWRLTTRRVASLEWFVAALDDHGQVLLSSDPARRQRTATALPPVTAPGPRTARATQTALTQRLRRLQAEHRARALSATGPAALLWAALAAFSGTAAVRLPDGFARLGDDSADLTPDPAGTRTDRVLALCLQAVHGYELALAASGLTAADRSALRRRLDSWRTLRTAVLATGVVAAPPPVGYDARPARTPAAAHALAVTVESAALPVLGAWLAGPAPEAERRLAVDALASAHTALTGFGGGALRWPGWPG